MMSQIDIAGSPTNCIEQQYYSDSVIGTTTEIGSQYNKQEQQQ